VLTKARVAEPSSADAAFYLAWLPPDHDIPNAISTSRRRQPEAPLRQRDSRDDRGIDPCGQARRCNEWIAVAEEHKVYPARVAFLKGAALAKEKRYDEAIAAFEKSKQLDPAYTPIRRFPDRGCAT